MPQQYPNIKPHVAPRQSASEVHCFVHTFVIIPQRSISPPARHSMVLVQVWQIMLPPFGMHVSVLVSQYWVAGSHGGLHVDPAWQVCEYGSQVKPELQ